MDGNVVAVHITGPLKAVIALGKGKKYCEIVIFPILWAINTILATPLLFVLQ
jgi:hypothetical protein